MVKALVPASMCSSTQEDYKLQGALCMTSSGAASVSIASVRIGQQQSSQVRLGSSHGYSGSREGAVASRCFTSTLECTGACAGGTSGPSSGLWLCTLRSSTSNRTNVHWNRRNTCKLTNLVARRSGMGGSSI